MHQLTLPANAHHHQLCLFQEAKQCMQLSHRVNPDIEYWTSQPYLSAAPRQADSQLLNKPIP